MCWAIKVYHCCNHPEPHLTTEKSCVCSRYFTTNDAGICNICQIRVSKGEIRLPQELNNNPDPKPPVPSPPRVLRVMNPDPGSSGSSTDSVDTPAVAPRKGLRSANPDLSSLDSSTGPSVTNFPTASTKPIKRLSTSAILPPAKRLSTGASSLLSPILEISGRDSFGSTPSSSTFDGNSRSPAAAKPVSLNDILLTNKLIFDWLVTEVSKKKGRREGLPPVRILARISDEKMGGIERWRYEGCEEGWEGAWRAGKEGK